MPAIAVAATQPSPRLRNQGARTVLRFLSQPQGGTFLPSGSIQPLPTHF